MVAPPRVTFLQQTCAINPIIRLRDYGGSARRDEVREAKMMTMDGQLPQRGECVLIGPMAAKYTVFRCNRRHS